MFHRLGEKWRLLKKAFCLDKSQHLDAKLPISTLFLHEY
jgi:hypothetical protein